MKYKKLFISLTAVLTVLLCLGIFILIWFVGDTYKDFKRFKEEFRIEGLEDGAVPQGLATRYSSYVDGVDDEGRPVKKVQDYFLQSAYMIDGSPSRIYVTGAETGYVGYVTMLNEDGTPHTGHVGGIATNGSHLWVGYGDSVLVAKSNKEYIDSANEEYKEQFATTTSILDNNILAELIDKAKKNNDLGEYEKLTIQFTASFKANCNAAFLYYFDDAAYNDVSYDKLYVGEFYRKGNYETDKSHRLETPAGYKNTAFMYEYTVNGNSANPYGLSLIDSTMNDTSFTEGNNVPKIQKIFSIPEMIQGVAFSGRKYSANDGGMLVLSQSYGLPNSHLLCFDWKSINDTTNRTQYTKLAGSSFVYKDVYRTVGGKQIPYSDSSLYVYYVDKGNEKMFVNDYSVPSMSEGMCVVTPSGSGHEPSKRIYVLFESGCKKYNMFTRESIKNVYSFIPAVK